MNAAELGYHIDSSEALVAKRNLSDMTRAAGQAETGADRLNRRLVALAGSIGTVAAAGQAFDRGFNLDQRLGELSTLMPGLEADLQAIEVAGLSLARQYGTSQSEQIASFYDAVSAGASTAAEAIAQMDAANRLALGGAASLDASLDILNTSVNAYADSFLTAADAADTLFTGVRFGVSTIEELSATMGRSIPVAAAVGVEYHELVALIAALTTQGQDSALAVTGVTAALSQIVAPSEEARSLARQLGIEFSAAGVQAMGFSEFLNEVMIATGGSEEQLASLFGSVEALRAVLSLAGQGGAVFNEILAAMEERTGAADQAMEQMSARSSEQWNRAMANLSTTNEQLGLTLLNTVAPAALEVTNVLVGAEDASLALEITLKALGSTAAVVGSIHLAGLATRAGTVAATYLATIPAVRAYVASIALVGPVSATATAATTALTVATRALMGPFGLALTAVGALTTAWVLYEDGQQEARWASEELNEALAEQAKLSAENASATRAGAEEELAAARATRERLAATLALRQAFLESQYQALAGPQYGGAMLRDVQDQATLRRIRIVQQDLAEIEESRASNLAEIADLEERIARFVEEEASARHEAAEAADAEFDAIIEGLRRERAALTLSRQEREMRLAIMDIEQKLGRDLSEAQENAIRDELRLLVLREEEIDQYDRMTDSVEGYRAEIGALESLMQTGSISVAGFYSALLDNRLAQQTRDLDAYLRAAGAVIGLNAIDRELAGNDNDPYASGFTDPALALHGDELIRLQEQFYQRQFILQQMRDAEIITHEEHQRRLTELERIGAAERAQLEREAYATQLSAASSTFDSISQITAAFAGEQSGLYRGMFAVSKAFSIAESMINIQQAMSEALALPFPANIPAMGLVAAEGAAIIANLQAVAGTGFMAGGYTGDLPINAVAGVVHGQEWVFDAQTTRQIGRDNLEYMARTGSIPANDRQVSGAGPGRTEYYDLRGALVTRDVIEEIQQRQSRVEARLVESEEQLPERIQEINRENYERGAA